MKMVFIKEALAMVTDITESKKQKKTLKKKK
jgi:hypothetical protein